MYYSYKGQYPINELPDRIRLSNGITRTDRSSYTADEISDAGYIIVNDPPSITQFQTLNWNGEDWNIIDQTQVMTDEKWHEVRIQRDKLINEIEWRVQRYLSFQRQNKTQIDNIEHLDLYIQQLRDVTLQSDPFNIIWPDYLYPTE